jgi:hypothetical protein
MFGFNRRTQPVTSSCNHTGALPRWERVEDMGDPQKAARLFCPDCDQFVSTSDYSTSDSAPEWQNPGPEAHGRP